MISLHDALVHATDTHTEYMLIHLFNAEAIPSDWNSLYRVIGIWDAAGRPDDCARFVSEITKHRQVTTRDGGYMLVRPWTGTLYK